MPRQDCRYPSRATRSNQRPGRFAGVVAVAGPGREPEQVRVRRPPAPAFREAAQRVPVARTQESWLNLHNRRQAARAYTGRARATFFSAFGDLLRVLVRLRV